MKVRLTSYTPNPELVCAKAARMCYSPTSALDDVMSPEAIDKMLNRVIKSGHLSTIEHAYFTFEIIDVSRAMTHQLVRHRIASFCLSGDTVVYSDRMNREVIKRTLSEIYALKPQYRKTMKIRCMNEDTKEITSGKILNIIQSGKRDVFKVSTENGYEIKSSLKHKFLTEYGWKQLSEISVGDKIYTNGIEAYKDKTWLNNKYNIEKLTHEEIGELCGISKHTVRAWIRKFKLTKPLGSWSIKKTPPNKGMNKENYEPMNNISKKMIGNKNSRRLFGKDNHMYRGENITKSGGYYRTHCIKEKTGTCEVCGCVTKTEIHHRDKNPKNIDDTNIVELCMLCHKLEHKGSVVKVVRLQQIISIESVGIEETYDIEMDAPNHNFIANGFIVHNSQQSQRYVKMDKPSFVAPPSCVGDKEHLSTFYATEVVARAMEDAWGSYNKLIEAGIPAEDARFVLPNACTTNITMSMNARELLHFLSLRMCNRAQWEIRAVADEIYKQLMEVAPGIFKYAGPNCWTGKCTETQPCGHPRVKT